MSASDTSIFNQKNGTDEKPKAWFETYGFEIEFSQGHRRDENW